MKASAVIVSPPAFNSIRDVGCGDVSRGFRNTKTSYLSLKSSVLSPSSTRLTNQYLALEQLRAHYDMIVRAKACVDTSSPKSMNSSLSRIGQKRREIWRTRSATSLYSVNGLSGMTSPEILCSHYVETVPKETKCSRNQNLEETELVPDDGITVGDKVSWYLNTVPSFRDKYNAKNMKNVKDSSKKTQLYNHQQNISVADKISWYLEAVQQGAFVSDLTSSANDYSSDNVSSSSNELLQQNSPSRKRCLKKGSNRATAQKVNNSTYTIKSKIVPRTSSKIQAKSKLLNMKCYHPPIQRKKYKLHKKPVIQEPENTYDDSSNNSDDDDRVLYHESRVDDNQQVPERLKRPSTVKEQRSYDLYSSPLRRYRSSLDLLSRNEAKYLAFIQSVTEDILNTGIYTDRAIRKALDFHVRRQTDLDPNIVKQLMDQFLEDLSISKEETSLSTTLDIGDSAGRSTPPERDNVHFASNDNGAGTDSVFPISVTVTTAQTNPNVENNDTALEEFGCSSPTTEVPDKCQSIFD